MAHQMRLARAHDNSAPDAVIADPAERQRVAGYLRSATPILATTATVADRYAPERGKPVGLTVRSDGTWVWSDAHAYYVEHHGIAPEPDFYSHIKAANYRCHQIDPDTAARALAVFDDPP